MIRKIDRNEIFKLQYPPHVFDSYAKRVHGVYLSPCSIRFVMQHRDTTCMSTLNTAYRSRILEILTRRSVDTGCCLRVHPLRCMEFGQKSRHIYSGRCKYMSIGEFFPPSIRMEAMVIIYDSNIEQSKQIISGWGSAPALCRNQSTTM